MTDRSVVEEMQLPQFDHAPSALPQALALLLSLIFLPQIHSPNAIAETNKEKIVAAKAARDALEKLEVDPNDLPVFACVNPEAGTQVPAILVTHETGPLAVYISRPRTSHRAVFIGEQLEHEKLKGPVPLTENFCEVKGFRADRIEGSPGPQWMFQMLPYDADILANEDPLLVRSDTGWTPISASLIYGNPILAPGDFSTAEPLFNPEVVPNVPEGAPVVLAETGHLVGIITFSGHLLKMRRIRELVTPPRAIPPTCTEVLWGFGRADLNSQELADLLEGIFPPDSLLFEPGRTTADIFTDHREALSNLYLNQRGFSVSRHSGGAYWFDDYVVTSQRSGIVEIDFRSSYYEPYDKDRLTRLYQFYFKVFGVPDEIGVIENEFEGRKVTRSVVSAWHRESATVYLYTAHSPADGLFLAAHLEPPESRLESRFTAFEKLSNPSVRAVPTIKRWMDDTESFEKRLTEQAPPSGSR